MDVGSFLLSGLTGLGHADEVYDMLRFVDAYTYLYDCSCELNHRHLHHLDWLKFALLVSLK